jgi:hypothetical protein
VAWNSETNIKGPPGPKGDKGDPGSGGASDWADITGKPATFPPTLPITESDVTNLVSDLAAKAPLASPVFTGNPVAPTPAVGDNDTSVATTAFVRSAIAAFAAGQIFYLDPTDAADVATYKRLALSPSAAAESSLAVVCTGTTSDFLIGSFITDPGVPGAIEYPAGSAYRRLYGKVSGGTAKFRLQVYVRNTGGTETLVRDEFSNDFSDTVPTLQEWLATPPGGGMLSTTDRLVAKISARRVTGPTNVTVTLYGEGSAHASQIQTTLSPSAGGGGGGGGAAVLVSDTPPVGAADNSLWFESDTGNMYIRLNDGTSTQWVAAFKGASSTALRGGMKYWFNGGAVS